MIALATSGCPDAHAPGAPKACSHAYDKCTLPSGVLGVCDAVDCTDGQTAPCFVCRSQH